LLEVVRVVEFLCNWIFDDIKRLLKLPSLLGVINNRNLLNQDALDEVLIGASK
jgi:hypothetical protein